MYSLAYDVNGEPPRKTHIFISNHGVNGLRCNAVGGRFGYGFSFPVRREGNTFIEVRMDWSKGKVMPTGEKYLDVLGRM